jgi:hypothetical protein
MNIQWTDIKHQLHAKKLTSKTKLSELTKQDRHFLKAIKSLIMFFPQYPVDQELVNTVQSLPYYNIIQPYLIDALIPSRYPYLSSEVLYYHLKYNSYMPDSLSDRLYYTVYHDICDHKLSKPLVIADMGSGQNKLADFLSKTQPLWYVHNIDMIKTAKSTLQMNMKKTCITSRSCDFVVFNHSLWGKRGDLEDYFKEAYRILIPDGYVIIYDDTKILQKVINLHIVTNKYQFLTNKLKNTTYPSIKLKKVNPSSYIFKRTDTSDDIGINSLKLSPSITYEFLND